MKWCSGLWRPWTRRAKTRASLGRQRQCTIPCSEYSIKTITLLSTTTFLKYPSTGTMPSSMAMNTSMLIPAFSEMRNSRIRPTRMARGARKMPNGSFKILQWHRTTLPGKPRPNKVKRFINSQWGIQEGILTIFAFPIWNPPRETSTTPKTNISPLVWSQ